MRSFQLCEHQRTTILGSVFVHARLKALRGEHWSVVGVFQLAEGEWDELAELCTRLGMAVTQDAEESISS